MSTKKRIKPGRLEPSADGSSIVVHFVTEVTHLSEDGIPSKVEKIPDKREVSVAKALKGLRSLDDIPGLAQEIVDKCKYIPAKRVRDVEQVLQSMAESMGTLEGDNLACVPVPSSPSPPATLRLGDVLPYATYDNIDDYVDELYEDKMELKARGSKCLLTLCTQVRHLDSLSKHSTLLGVLSRELRENAKRSYELAVAISGIFLCLSNFPQFHGALARNQCSDVTMRVVEYESRRRNVLQKELEESRQQLVAKGSQATSEDHAHVKKEERRFKLLLDRQDRLLHICHMTLRNLAEDVALERKISQQKVCHYLVQLLGRSRCEDLLLCILGFLQKLVVFRENKDQLAKSEEGLSRLADLAGHQSVDVCLLALRVAYNISFDVRARSVLATQTSLFGPLTSAIQRPPVRQVALKLLYHISMDGPARANMVNRQPECIVMMMQMAVHSKKRAAEQDVAAILINFATDETVVASMVELEPMPPLIMRAIQHADPVLLKVVRNMVSHDSTRARLLQVMQEDTRGMSWLEELLHLGLSSDSPDVQLEVIGCFACLDEVSPQVPWPDFCEAGLLDLLHRLLMVGFSEDDIILECVMLTGILALDPESIAILATSKVISALPNILAEKHEDSEIVVQLLFTIRCLLRQEETREVVLQTTDIPDRVLDLYIDIGSQQAAAQAVQAAAEQTLDSIVRAESEIGRGTPWAERIKAFRFEKHNQEWCEALKRGDWPEEDRVSKKALPPELNMRRTMTDLRRPVDAPLAPPTEQRMRCTVAGIGDGLNERGWADTKRGKFKGPCIDEDDDDDRYPSPFSGGRKPLMR
eukprot:gnl/TRDRNA2_/TRDRNA2_157177_c0_seq5.p1 gnl/TRDRNA2_/TRDRNA2_157177_c0~~gnl/TRDRNA2_/TRDRNA2_157177_c0_seq5.p1  ORF type:complete len:814 (-),score=140.75 gnl/TRDRNA2_/TRDRNA2_157177_c0_seq5:78-2519(-)